jgi:hypothetical protein
MLMSAFRSIRGQNYGWKSQDRADAVVFSRSMTNDAMKLLSPRTKLLLREHAKIIGVAPELSQMQEVVRHIQAERADEFGDWRARVLWCVEFFTLLLVAVIAARWLS